MACVQIPDERREITDPDQIAEFLRPYGIWYEKWNVEQRIGPEATNEEILEAFAPEIERLKRKGGYVTADVINVTKDVPGLEAMLAKFSKEHTHTEDEVRFTVKGRGVFRVNPENGPVFGIQVESGDLINVPAGIRHWFYLCDDREIQCIRMFLDPAGWAPHYTDEPVHEKYASLCFGPDFIPPADDLDPVVKV
jgi:1,2-dihydroxy-3-keto-5-methylthiopentene dioxygenase